MTRFVAPALAALIALLFLVAPSIVRLGFLLEPTASTAPTDLAFATNRGLGFLHILPGLLMVVLAPVQLSDALRRRSPLVHRVSGWAFVLTGLALSTTGAVMNVQFPVVGGWLKLSVIWVMCVALVVTLGLALLALRRRDVAGHRRWMLRAVGIALSGGTAGIFAGPLFVMNGTVSDLMVGVSRWLGFLITVGLVEVFLRRAQVLGVGGSSRRTSQ